MELPPYSETLRDEVEQRLAEAAQKRELIIERRHGLSIRVYWLKLTNEVSMMLINEADNSAREFLVPPDCVMDAVNHPEYYATENGLNALDDHESRALRKLDKQK